MTAKQACVRPGCSSRFVPEYLGHICCSQGCWTAILHHEIGRSAAGMRPFGMMGDRKKIAGVRRKYERLAEQKDHPRSNRLADPIITPPQEREGT
jgi:hypothetical protein